MPGTRNMSKLFLVVSMRADPLRMLPGLIVAVLMLLYWLCQQ
jgi:hypothetical protein